MKNIFKTPKLKFFLLFSFLIGLLPQLSAQYCSGNTVYADIAAIELPIHYNRLGVHNPTSMIYALKSDIYKDNAAFTIKDGKEVPCSSIEGDCAGCMRLKPQKRPRSIVLRTNVGDKLVVRLTNYINPKGKKVPEVGFSINGIAFINGTEDDGSWVGTNTNNQVKPNETKEYQLLTPEEGSFLIRDAASETTSYDGFFGSLTVQPKNAEWYRSQVTQLDLFHATKHYLDTLGHIMKFPKVIIINNDNKKDTVYYLTKPTTIPAHPPGHPVIDYSKLRMYESISKTERRLTYTDLTAIITGPDASRFSDADTSAVFNPIPSSPDRRQPYREISVHYHNTFAGGMI